MSKLKIINFSKYQKLKCLFFKLSKVKKSIFRDDQIFKMSKFKLINWVMGKKFTLFSLTDDDCEYRLKIFEVSN
jgi:hypothetical protein